MADVFIDSGLATGLNDGTTFDDAYQTVKAGMEATRVAGDKVWIRRRSSHVSAANIQPTNVGNASSFVTMQGCPRNEKPGTITFTNGSTVLIASSITPDFEKHCTRLIKCDANGEWYTLSAVVLKIAYDGETGTFTEGLMVTDGTSGATGKIHRIQDDGTTGYLWVVVKSGTFANNNAITDTDTGVAVVNGTPADDGFTIMGKYEGTTATTTAFTIQKDEDYSIFQAIDDSTWTIKKTDWQADADDLVRLDFAAGAFYLYVYANFYKFKNLYLKNSASSYGLVWMRVIKHIEFRNCIFEQVTNNEIINLYAFGTAQLVQCMFKGNGTGAAQIGISSVGHVYAKDCAIYNCGDHGLALQFDNILKNVNIGIELPNGDDEIRIYYGHIYGNSVRLGGTNGLVANTNVPNDRVYIENYNGILGAHRTFNSAGYLIKKDVVAGSGNPYKRTGGADSVIEWHPTTATLHQGIDSIAEELFIYEFDAAAGSKTYKIYLQNSACGNFNTSDSAESSDIFMEAEYISGYGATDKYVTGRASGGFYPLRSTSSVNPIPNRGSVSDWDDYIQITINPAVASKVRITLKSRLYSAAGILYLDPKMVIT